MNWLIKIYHYSSRLRILNNLTKIFISRKLTESINYYNYNKNPEEQLNPYGITNASMISFLICFISIFLSFYFINYYISIFISLIFGLIISKKVYSYLIIQYRIHKDNFLQYLDLIYQDFLLIINSSGTILDCVKYIAQSKYPVISDYFKNIQKRINMGYVPEVLLIEFLEITSNQTFKENILSLISSNLNKKFITNNNPEFSIELKTKFQKQTTILESKLTIITTINIFLPIITITIFSIYFASNLYLFFLLIPFHLLLLNLLKKSLLNKDFTFLGNIIGYEKELNQLINLLTTFANYLRLGNSPEVSLFKSFKLMETKSEYSSEKYNITIRNYTFDEVWNNLENRFLENQSRILLRLVSKMIKKNSIETGIRIKNILDNIKSNKRIVAKRKLLLKSVQFKLIILLIILSSLMGLMANILPIFGQFFQIIIGNQYINISDLSISINNIVPILITFLVIIFFTSKTMLDIVKFRYTIPISMILIILFFSIYYGTYILLNFVLSI
ncbi:MAG: hypothetical protein ACTSPY_00330 [Candidatus Helarchaeota archaeon]